MTERAVYIWVRDTIDWASGEAVRSEFQPRVDLWNATFNMPFHQFRDRLSEIARLNRTRVEGAICAGWEEIPDGALVLPVDDDDWFSPDAARALIGAFDPRAEVYIWPSSWIEVPRTLGHRLYLIQQRLLLWAPPKFICTTNNYATVKSEAAKPLLTWHTVASRRFEGRVRKADDRTVKRIDRRLSVANRTLASQTNLRFSEPSMSRSELVRTFRRYRWLYDRPPRRGLGWCRPYLEMMSALMAELELRDSR